MEKKMPKQRITKEMVVEAAFEIARNDGMEQVLVKNIAEKIGCSVQPIYSYCRNIDGLKADVTGRALEFVREFAAAHIDPSDLFASTGRAYVQLAKEEPNIFKLFILHQREGVSSLSELYQKETDPRTAGFIADRLKISREEAKNLHLHMLIYTIGIGTIFCMTTPGISTEEIFEQQEKAYQIFLKETLENKRNGNQHG